METKSKKLERLGNRMANIKRLFSSLLNEMKMLEAQHEDLIKQYYKEVEIK